MIKLFEKLFHGCEHKWKVIEEVPIIESVYGYKYEVGKRFYQQCKLCGRLKKRTFMN